MLETLAVAIANLLVFLLGASIGSFLNVVVYRLPAQLSLLYPPSRCPRCRHRLGVRENIPILGWLTLRGRCRWCRRPISKRYPLVEAASGLLFLLVFWQFGWTLTTLGYWTFLSWLLALSLIDWDTMTLPNELTSWGLVVGLGFGALIGWQGTEAAVATELMRGISSAVLGIWLFDAIALFGTVLFGQAAMGGGDPKLAAMIGAWLGWKLLLLTGFLACALGAFVGGGAMYCGLIDRQQPMPFGPFLAAGAALSVYWGPALISTYLNIFFPAYSN